MRFSAVLLAGLLAAACAAGGNERGTHDAARGEMTPLAAAGVSREMPSKAPTRAMVAGMTQFGDDLYRQIAVPGKNVVLSPLSLATAWGMLRAGAAGETAAQLDRVFGFPDKGTHEALNVLTRKLVTIDGPPPTTSPTQSTSKDTKPTTPLVAVANGLFVQNGYQVKEGYLRTLATQYGAGLNSVDFTSPQAKELIDAWVKEHTANRITKLFDQIPASARLVLANAVYFKGDWLKPFDSATPAPFTRADGSVVQVPMMRVETYLKYAESDGWQAVELPYRGNQLSMLVMIPTDGTDPSALLDPGVLANARATLGLLGVHLSMPRWNFGTTIELLEPLAKLGLTALNDLSGVSAGGLSISQAVHRANITVDEHGTEAAAVTGIEADSYHPEVRADRPFVFAIVHKPTGTPLFVGQVADPTAS